MKNVVLNYLSNIKNTIRSRVFKYDYSYIYYDSYLPGEKRLVPVNIDFFKFTILCEIMKKYGSDKGCFVGMSKHNYTPLYHILFKKNINKKINLFELGIGTKNINIPANMGCSGIPGASLYGWKNYFSKANIYGADIDKSILIKDDRIKTFYCDQTNPHAIKNMWLETGQDKYDIILDDGLHEFKANVCFFENSINKLASGGVYIVEDVIFDELERWISYFKEYSIKEKQLRFSILKIPNPFNTHDNNLIVIQNIS